MTTTWISHIDDVKGIASSPGTRLLYKEFGMLGAGNQSQIQAVANTLISVSLFLGNIFIKRKSCVLLGGYGCVSS